MQPDSTDPEERVEGHEIMKKNMSTNGVCVQDSDEYGEYEIMNGIEKDKGTTTRGTRGTDDDSWSLIVSRKTTRNLSKIRTGNRKTKINIKNVYEVHNFVNNPP
jgi:hypothetical protein